MMLSCTGLAGVTVLAGVAAFWMILTGVLATVMVSCTGIISFTFFSAAAAACTAAVTSAAAISATSAAFTAC